MRSSSFYNMKIIIKRIGQSKYKLLTCGVTSSSLNVIGVPETKRRKKWGRKIFEEIGVKTYLCSIKA